MQKEIQQLYSQKRFEEVIQKAKTVLKRREDDPSLHILIGNSFLQLNRFEEAKEHLKKALKTDFPSATVLFNLAGLYFMEGNFKESLKHFEKALKLQPSNSEIYYNIGVVYQEMNEFKKAKKYYHKALKLNPSDINSLYNLSLIFLTEGDYKQGFDYYRSRYHPTLQNRQTSLLFPSNLLNKGDEIKGKNLFVYNEQGMGDMIQFIRFLPLFLQKGAKKIILQMPSSLKRLFKYNYPNITFSDDLEKDQKIEYDYHFPLMESAYILDLKKDEIPYKKGYLKVDKNDAKIYREKNIIDENKKKVGIVWRTNLLDSNDLITKIRSKTKRELSLEDFIKHLKNKNIRFYSLQKDETTKERELLKKRGIISLDDTLKDFYDTALAIENLDTIISIDTAVAHLGAAMGKETFILLPFNNDWRWGQNEKVSTWYENAKLLRQESAKKGSLKTILSEKFIDL